MSCQICFARIRGFVSFQLLWAPSRKWLMTELRNKLWFYMLLIGVFFSCSSHRSMCCPDFCSKIKMNRSFVFKSKFGTNVFVNPQMWSDFGLNLFRLFFRTFMFRLSLNFFLTFYVFFINGPVAGNTPHKFSLMTQCYSQTLFLTTIYMNHSFFS